MKHTLTFDITTKHTTKPSNPAAVSINLNTQKEVSIDDFATMVSQPNGFSWCPAIFNGKRSNDNWINQSCFALDFDSGITPDAVVAILSDYNITANVIYPSFSDKPELRKFRVVIFIDKVITDRVEAKFIILNLMNLVKDADGACKDYARMFFGGKEMISINNIENSYDNIISVLNTVQVANDKMRTRGVRKATHNTTDINNVDFDTIYKDGYTVKDFDFEKAAIEVSIFNDFLNGVWLTHPQIFGLATNLSWVKGGLKLMKETMLKYNKEGKTKYTDNNFAALMTANKNKYLPQRLENFSTHESDFQHTNLINAVRDIRGEVERVGEVTELISLAKAEYLFGEAFDNAINTQGNGVYLLKVPTGLGKTKALEDLINVTIALPTHNLKEEVSERMIVPHKVSPNLPIFSTKINDELEFYFNLGLVKKANKLIKTIAEQKDLKTYTHDDIMKAFEYTKANIECLRTTDAVLTTHQKALFVDYNNDTIIFDEDPLSSILPIKSFNIGDLITLEGFEDISQDMKAIVDYLRNMLPAAQFVETPLFRINLDNIINAVLKSKINNNIVEFFDSLFMIKNQNDVNTIHYILKRDLPQNKKIIVLSATASTFMYEKMFGDKLTVVDLTDVEQVGEVIQYTKYSYSKSCINKRLPEIVEQVGVLPVITFAQNKKDFLNPIEHMHFGNCSGYDTHNGIDIAVVGTFHLNEFAYFLYAKALGIKLTTFGNLQSYQMIDWNGFRFKFSTYENEDLRKIQLSLIEGELTQAIGRNRTLRNICTVHVYSNFPLKQTTKFKKE